jgi:hypothetical protein
VIALTEGAQMQIVAESIDGYEQTLRRAHAQNVVVYGGTIMPMKRHSYHHETGWREAARQIANNWIRTSGRFDAAIDFDRRRTGDRIVFGCSVLTPGAS